MKLTYATIALYLATAAPLASGQVLNERCKLTASDAAATDLFGISVATSGSIAIAGAQHDDDAGVDSGSAYLFNTSTGQPLFKLTASDAAAGDEFGRSVAISGPAGIVGAPFDDDGGPDSGSAYLFDTTTGQQLFKLTASDAAASDDFGHRVAVSGSIAVVGARFDDDAGTDSGSAYIFDGTTGQQLFKLTANDAAAGDEFGASVAIAGTIAIVGARSDDDAGTDSGSAYVFDTTTGQQLFKLTASDAAAGDEFGISVAISGTTAIVGARLDDDTGTDSGAAYVFDSTTGAQLVKLTASDAEAGDFFGRSVALSGTTAICGAIGADDVGTDSGSAYVFDTTTGQQLFNLTASDSAAGDEFGISLAISGSSVFIGAYRNDDAGENSGSAYVFDLANLCPGDIADDFGTLGADGMVSFGDFLALLGLIGPCPGGTPGCTGDIADDFGSPCNDGMVSFGDFLALLGLIGPCA